MNARLVAGMMAAGFLGGGVTKATDAVFQYRIGEGNDEVFLWLPSDAERIRGLVQYCGGDPAGGPDGGMAGWRWEPECRP